MTAEPHIATLAELSRQLGARERSPVELLQTCLDRIASIDSSLHSFNALRAEAAMVEARLAEQAIMQGNRTGPMHGIPVGIKDLIDVAGLPTTAQAAHRANAVARADAGVVAALKQAGAIILGKQAMPEYAVGITQFDAPWPPARNPWNLEYNPSGSSSGSAISVAAGLCPGSVGSETAGSIRDPASWCGVAGLKPTDGLVSLAGVLPLARSMDCLGPLAWSVEDCALMLPAMVAPSSAPALLQRLSTLDLGKSIKGVRVGVVRHFYEGDADMAPAVLTAMDNALCVLSDLGAHLSTVRLEDFSVYAATARAISWPEEYAEHGAELRDHPERFGPVTRSRVEDGKDVPAHVYINARRRQTELVNGINKVMRDVDVLVLPTTKKPAQLLDYETTPVGEIELSLTRPFNLTGNPALSFCNGFSEQGLPLALQIVGRHLEEDLILRVGHAVETALGLRSRRPPILGNMKAR